MPSNNNDDESHDGEEEKPESDEEQSDSSEHLKEEFSIHTVSVSAEHDSTTKPIIEDPKQREYASYKSETTETKPRDPFWRNVAILAFLGVIICAILLLILYFTIGQKSDDPKEPPKSTLISSTGGLDPDWVESVKDRQTTPLDAYDTEDPSCDFSDVNQPNPILQCQCGDTIDRIAPDIQDLYDEMRLNLVPALYGSDWSDVSRNSCDPRNQALLWLSSGNARQNADDLWQRFVLALLYVEWGGPDWDDANLWWTDSSECKWIYVTCNGNTRLVSSFGFDEMNLFGTLPTELVFLSQLRALSITRNHLEGTIPSELMGIATLESLALYDNTLTGSIPSEIAQLSDALLEFRVQQNELSGALTTELGLATHLRELKLGFNSLREPIPSQLGELTQLTTLAMEENNLSGSIPTQFGRLTALRTLILNQLLLTGALPSQLGHLGELETLQIIGSGTSGAIPPQLGNAQQLHRLDINDNKLEGALPSDLGQMTNLYFLAANDNRLTGTLPSEFGLMTNMTRFVVFDNDLSGLVPTEFGALEDLDVLSLYQNPKLTGNMPQEVCDNNPGGDEFDIIVQCAQEEGDDTGIFCPEDCCLCKRGRR